MEMNNDKFNKAVVSLSKSLDKQKAVIQELAVFAIQQSIEHRNADPATRLIQAVDKKGIYRSTLSAFMETFGQLKFQAGDKKHLCRMQFKERPEVDFNEEQLMLVDWATFKKEPEVSIYDVDTGFRKFLASIHKKAESGNVKALLDVNGEAFGMDGRVNILDVLDAVMDNFDKALIAEKLEATAEEVVEEERKAA